MRSLRRASVIGLLLLLAGSAGSAWAEEIIYFTNGTTLAIVSHNVKDGMIHVDLGANALIAFPESMVDRIEEAGKDVYLSASVQRANVAASRVAGGGNVQVRSPATAGSNPVRGSSTVNSRFRSGLPGDGNADRINQGAGNPGVPTTGFDRFGVYTNYPLANHTNRAARKIGVQGKPPLRTYQKIPGDLRGAQRFGTGHVINTRSNSRHAPSGRTSPQRFGATIGPTRTDPPKTGDEGGTTSGGAAAGGTASGDDN